MFRISDVDQGLGIIKSKFKVVWKYCVGEALKVLEPSKLGS